jgi:nucleoside-diphosphate-sugar epimerase
MRRNRDETILRFHKGEIPILIESYRDFLEVDDLMNCVLAGLHTDDFSCRYLCWDYEI